MIVNSDRKTFIVQATSLSLPLPDEADSPVGLLVGGAADVQADRLRQRHPVHVHPPQRS